MLKSTVNFRVHLLLRLNLDNRYSFCTYLFIFILCTKMHINAQSKFVHVGTHEYNMMKIHNYIGES